MSKRDFKAGVNKKGSKYEKSIQVTKETAHTALLESVRREAKESALTAVLDAAQKIYEEDMESDPSDYLYTRKAVEMAKAAAQATGSFEGEMR
jgi:hypothetical protein